MSYANINLNQILTQCHYEQSTKSYMHQEQMNVMQVYQMSYRAVQTKLQSGTFLILEASGTIPVIYSNQTYNIPVKLQYLPGYPNIAPVLVVNPSPDMMIKPSKFVQEDGKTILAITQAWNPRCTTIQVLEEAKKVYGINMPVFKRSVQQNSPNGVPGNSSKLNLVGQYLQNNLYGGLYTPVQPVRSNAADPSYVNLATKPSESRNLVNNPVQNHRPAAFPGKSKTIYTESDIEKVKEIYKSCSNDLKNEIKVLETEAKQLESSSLVIKNSIENFKKELASGQRKKDLLEASIKNTQDWISASSSSAFSDLSENDLIEYKNEYVKMYLELSSQERAVESTIQVMVDAINKSVVPPKEILPVLKQLYIDCFLASRLKEKCLKFSNDLS